MIGWIESVKQKSEGTRRAIAAGIFIMVTGIIITIWLWNLQGSFPYENVAASTQTLNETLGASLQDFQVFRSKLGEFRQKLFDAFSEKPIEQVQSEQKDVRQTEQQNY